MSILKKAQELGQEIAVSKELADMRNAEMLMMQDEQAKKIIEEFHEKQHFFMDLQRNGQALTDSQKEEVQKLEEIMLEQPLIYSFFQAQQNFEKVLEQINDIISKAIMGEAPSCSDDCCTSCSGCGH